MVFRLGLGILIFDTLAAYFGGRLETQRPFLPLARRLAMRNYVFPFLPLTKNKDCFYQ